MEKLSQKRREVFKISKIDELSNKEIAKKLGISVRSMVFGQLVGVYISQAREHAEHEYIPHPFQMLRFGMPFQQQLYLRLNQVILSDRLLLQTVISEGIGVYQPVLIGVGYHLLQIAQVLDNIIMTVTAVSTVIQVEAADKPVVHRRDGVVVHTIFLMYIGGKNLLRVLILAQRPFTYRIPYKGSLLADLPVIKLQQHIPFVRLAQIRAFQLFSRHPAVFAEKVPGTLLENIPYIFQLFIYLTGRMTVTFSRVKIPVRAFEDGDFRLFGVIPILPFENKKSV